MKRPVVVTGLGVDLSSQGKTPLERAKTLTISVLEQALSQSGYPEADIACTFSASKPFIGEDEVVSADFVNRLTIQQFGLKGESRNVIAACATGAYSIATAASWIEQGLCDVAIAGSVEPAPHPLFLAGFQKMGVLSRENVMRPFDARRSGFVFGEGAAAIVLESEDHAFRRSAKPLARLSGWALGSDSHGPVSFNSNGERIADVVRKALQKAQLKPTAVSHINAHGTGTSLNDRLETSAIHSVFGRHAREIAVSATKSSTGHLLGAAGSVEFAFTVQAIANQQVLPTLHWEERDPACDLDYVTEGVPRPWEIHHAMSLSFGFGGPIGVLAVSRC